MESYDICLGPHSSRLILGRGSRHELIRQLSDRDGALLVVSDETVASHLRDKLLSSVPWLTVAAGEGSKDLSTLSSVWSGLITEGLDRSSALVAVGGGVIGDLAGFAASTYLRGIPFYSIPTSLLAMVDASVGGKVGIDLGEGKNLVGSFYPATTVAVDPELLATLPLSQWSQGMAEVIKHAILSGPKLWQLLVGFDPANRECPDTVSEVLREAVMVKVGVVREDPFEKTGVRATLNLGHTFGHAIEWCSSYELGHGSAIALGLVAGLRLSRLLGLLENDFEDQLLELLERWHLPTTIDAGDERWSWDKMELAFGRDKKNRDGRWCFVLPTQIGSVTTVFGPPVEIVKEAFLSLSTERARR